MKIFNFKSRRSPVYGTKGAVATTQPLASQIGMAILQKGGNCCDAAVAIAAALNVTEPCSTGVGGDCFMIYFDAKTGKVHGLNGSGRAPQALSMELLNSKGYTETNPWDRYSALTVTVPGSRTEPLFA
jgi:gamma-glutamyltranspeptidase/glutathione hydrolase